MILLNVKIAEDQIALEHNGVYLDLHNYFHGPFSPLAQVHDRANLSYGAPAQ